MADPDEALIEAIAEAICGHASDWSIETEGFKDDYRREARRAYAAMVAHLGLVEETRLIHAPHARVGHVLVLDGGWKWGADGIKQRRLVSRWMEVDHGSE